MKPQHPPLVSIGVPTRNRAKTLMRAVDSIREQNWPRLEIIISDNASSDRTEHLCRDLARTDPRVRYVRQPHNLGPFPNFEFVLRAAEGELFMWVSDDDFLEPGVLECYVAYLQSHPEYVLVSGVIGYMREGAVGLEERGLTFAQEDPVERVLAFYRRVERCGIFHGLMRTEIARQVGVKNLLGSDWHFVAGLLRFGKIEQLDFPAYRKDLSGFSEGFENYARVIGASRFSRFNPFITIAWHAAMDLMSDSRCLPRLSRRRAVLAAAVFVSILRRFYFAVLRRDPAEFVRTVIRSGVKTVMPERRS